MKKMIKLFRSLLLLAVPFLGLSAVAAANAETIWLAVGESTNRTMSENLSGQWSQTAGDSKIASVTGFSATSANSKAVTIKGEGPGTTTWTFSYELFYGVLGNDSWTYTVHVGEVVQKELLSGEKITLPHVPGGTTTYFWKVATSDSSVVTVSPNTASGYEQGRDLNVEATAQNKAGTARVTVTYYTRSGSNGRYTYTQQGAYYYDITVSTKDTVDCAAQTIVYGEPFTLPLPEGAGAVVKASSVDPSVATVGTTSAVVTPVKVGTTSIKVEDANHIYVFPVTVVRQVVAEKLPAIELGAGENVTKTLTGLENVTVAQDSVAKVEKLTNGQYKVTGLTEGTTTLTLETSTQILQQDVLVRRYDITKNLTLVIGAGTSKTSYTYTYGSEPTFTNRNPGLIEVTKNGNTLTFTPKAVGTGAQVDVTAQVDGQSRNSTIHYVFTITETENGQNVWQPSSSDGYITYSGAAKVETPADGSLVLIYTNVNQVGSFSVADTYSAKVDVLAVAGGGAGGSSAKFGQGAGGGGAGGFSLVTNKIFAAGTFGVVVGKGGEGGRDVDIGACHGSQGEPSAVTNEFGYAFARAQGGGGGGAPADPVAKNGGSGGSGGGAAWYGGTVGEAGNGVDGQGVRGGVPSGKNCGGGGGGAAGAGGADGSRGTGRTSDLSGVNVMYAVGGLGGRNDTEALALDGQGPGFGGDGGNGGPGGNGSDGVVIVRVREVYRPIKVPIPTTNDLITARFLWEEGKTLTALDYAGKSFRSSTDSRLYSWADAIKEVTGTMSTTCSLSSTETDEEGNPLKLGVGYHTFEITLKDGYEWESTNAEGTAARAQSYRWVVVDDWSVVDAAINIHKSVWYQNESNATIQVTTRTSPEMSGGGVPNVLFLGGLCNYHKLAGGTVHDAINAAAKNANVDWYLYNNPGKTRPAVKNASGSLKKGETCTWTPEANLESDNHQVLKEFLQNIYNNVVNNQNGKTYDYIVLEFDGTRIANYYGDDIAALSSDVVGAVAEALKPFYESGSVIWIVDDWGTSRSGYYPWNPTTGENAYYRPTSFYSAQQADKELSATGWNALVALLDPKNYKANASGWTTANKTSFSGYWRVANNEGGSTTHSTSSTSCWVADKNDNQVHYSQSGTVAAYLESHIKAKPYNLSLRDKVVDPSQGLTVQKVTIQVCTKEVNGAASTAEADWHDLIAWDRKTDRVTFLDTDHVSGITNATMEVNIETNLVLATLENIDFQVWTRVDIDVLDDGNFRTSENAVYNQATGKWEKNPNEGQAYAEMFDSLGLAMGVYGEAETEVPWKFNAYTVSVRVIGGGEGCVAGKLGVHSQEFAEGSTVSVYYRGLGGYRLKSITVDGNPVDITDSNRTIYTFAELAANHEVVVEYEAFYGETSSTPVTNVYDAAVHVYPVTLTNWDVDPEKVEIRYALSEDAAEEDWLSADEFCERYADADHTTPGFNPTELTDVGDHTIYYRVYVLQEGYGEDGDWTIPGWVAVDPEVLWTDVQGGQDHSVITPRPIVARPESHRAIKVTEKVPTIGYTLTGFVAGEDVSVLGEGATAGWYVSTEAVIPAMGVYPTWVAGTGTNAPVQGREMGNYVLDLQRNSLAVEKELIEIGGVPQSPELDPEALYADTGVDRIEKVYDGVESHLTIEVTSKVIDIDTKVVTNDPLVPGRDYDIKYALGDPANPSVPPAEFDKTENPGRLHAGTNVVWYAVEVKGNQDKCYFWATNYQYIIIHPRPLEFESLSQTWEYDGTTHAYNEVKLNSGTLVDGDGWTAQTTASIKDVGTTPNEFNVTITSTKAEQSDYEITKVRGTLAVTPDNINIGGEEQPYDPSDPLDYGETGVLDAVKVYDGIPTNIVVDVKRPSDGSCHIWYTTNREDPDSWSTELPKFTDVCNQVVWYAVDGNPNYVAVTNFARVIIYPREVVVKADDRTVKKGAENPNDYTATVTGVIEAEQTRIGELIPYTVSCPTYDDYNDSMGVYEGIIVPKGTSGETVEETIGNYHVTYLPGNLIVEDDENVTKLWITDHLDAGEGKVFLAFQPTVNVPLTQKFVLELAAAGRIKVAVADTEEGLATATLQAVPLRDPAAALDFDKGWVWVKVTLPEGLATRAPGSPLLFKVVIDVPQGE